MKVVFTDDRGDSSVPQEMTELEMHLRNKALEDEGLEEAGFWRPAEEGE
jgi:hypothetical protein